MTGVRLDERLTVLVQLIQRWTKKGGVHLDIGSDHGGLLFRLFQNQHLHRAIAVEKNETPYRNSIEALSEVPVDVRLGDGLDEVQSGEMHSLSASGIGGRTICRILDSHPDRICDWLFFQPNKDVDLVRRWAFKAHFHLVEEVLTERLFTLLVFRREQQPDGSYDRLPLEPAFHFGPHLIKERNPVLERRLVEEREYYRPLAEFGEEASKRLNLIEGALREMQRRQVVG